jgi:hypothetical protein
VKDEFGFDVGTRPHGLSAEMPQAVRKHAEGGATALSAKPVLLSPGKPEAVVADAASAAEPPPPCASPGEFHGMRFVRYVPVAFAAKDWRVSARRIRALLAESRLEGIRRANGYWEVAYPYRYQFGTRGPALKRAQKQERSTA